MNTLVKLLLMFLSIAFLSCEKETYDPLAHDGRVFHNAEFLEELHGYPDSILVENEYYSLSSKAFRDFTPVGFCGNGYIPDTIPRFLEVNIAIRNSDGVFTSSNFTLSGIYVVREGEIWKPVHFIETPFGDTTFVVIRGPQWSIGDEISVMCKFHDANHNEILIKQEGIKIRRIE